MTITGSTSHTPNGTQYSLTNVLDATVGNVAFAGACLLIHPAAGNKALLAAGTSDGITGFGVITGACSLYTPGAGNGTWAATGSLAQARCGFAFVQRTDGSVMAIGGHYAAPLTSCETYSPIASTWTTSGALNLARTQPEAIQLNNTDILVAGGRTNTLTFLDYTTLTDIGAVTDTCETYNISGNAWSYVGKMSIARVGHKLFKLDDGRVIAIGGIGYNPTQGTTNAYLNSTEIYDPNLKYWSKGPSMAVPRAFFAAGRIGNSIYVMGGSETSTVIEYLDTVSMKWKTSMAAMVSPTVKLTGTVT
ncbi:MAG: hypothetical protein ACREQ5_35360, partial [Candidatus Dormibacteria bacterium]